MNTKNLLTFKTILEAGSFQKAADILGYTQSTVTFQIKQLEEELSYPLFEKIGRKMELTQVGEKILPYVESILQAEEEIMNYGKVLSEIKGTLKISVPDSILIYNMQSFIQAFTLNAPNIRLVIHSMSSDDIEQSILNGSADIGFNCEKNSYSSSLIYKRIAKYKTILVASPLVNKELLDFITPHQRKNISMICNEPNCDYQRTMTNYLESKDIVLNPYMKMQSIEAVKRSVMNNLGIAYIPTYAIHQEIDNGDLIHINTELDTKIYSAGYVYHKNKWLSPQMKLAIQLIENNQNNEYF